METVATEAASRLPEYGLLGIFTLIFMATIFILWKEASNERREFIATINELQKARVEDAKAIQNQLIEISRSNTEAMAGTASAIENTREAMIDVKTTVKDLGEELRLHRGTR